MRYAAGPKERRIERGEIVELAVRHDEKREQNEVSDDDRPQLRVACQSPKTGEPHRRRERTDLRHLAEEKFERRKLDILAGDAGASISSKRPSVRRLPDQMRRGEYERQRYADIDPRPRQRPPQRRHDDAYGQRNQIEDDQIFARQANAGDGAASDPPSLVATLCDPRQRPHAAEPGERLQQISRQQDAVGEEDRGEQNAQARERLRIAAATDEPSV